MEGLDIRGGDYLFGSCWPVVLVSVSFNLEDLQLSDWDSSEFKLH